MFCPHCGLESSAELNYCKRCGGGLSTSALTSTQETRPAAIQPSVAWAVGTTTTLLVLFGLGLLFLALGELSRGGVIPSVLVLSVIFGGLTILGSVTLLTLLWWRLLGAPGPEQRTRPALNKPEGLRALDEAGFGALPEAPARSVTEHTTRTFDPVRRER